MKKIIAVAIAGAFVAPVYAAEVTVGGEVEYYITDASSGTTGNTAENEITVTASEDLGNGMSVTAYVRSNSADSGISVSSGMGSIHIGNADGDTALNAYEDKADVAEQGAGKAGAASAATLTHAIRIEPNLGVEGLTLGVGLGYGAAATSEESSVGVAYSNSGLSVAYAEADVEQSNVTTKVTSVSYTYGPVYVAMDSVDGQGGVDGATAEAVALTYNYGPGKIFYEANEVNYNSSSAVLTSSANLKPKTTVIGISYKIGGLNTYVQTLNADDADGAASETDTTYFGVEYVF